MRELSMECLEKCIMVHPLIEIEVREQRKLDDRIVI